MTFLKAATLALILVLSGSVAVLAQTPEARVVVPDAPGGAFVAGCYKADRTLYGPHWLTFCLERRGTYTVRGGGLVCDGRVNWNVSRGEVSITLRRQSCNRNLAWAEADIVCRPRGLVSALLDELLRELLGGKSNKPRVVVPDRPTIGKLSCTYYPTVAGAGTREFFARRVLEAQP